MQSAKDFMNGVKEVSDRLDWQGQEIRKVPANQIDQLSIEYNDLCGGSINANPNLRGEYIINEYSLREGRGKNLFKPYRENIVYGNLKPKK